MTGLDNVLMGGFRYREVGVGLGTWVGSQRVGWCFIDAGFVSWSRAVRP
jgi:hypothetical protein